MASIQHSPIVHEHQSVRERGRAMSPGRIIGGIVGVVLAIAGVVAITRGGIDGSLNKPLVQVFGMTQSAMVGLIELAAGLLLIGCAASESARPYMGAIGALALIAGVVGAASSVQIRLDVGFGKSTAVFVAILGAIALAAALVPAVWGSDRDVVTETDVTT